MRYHVHPETGEVGPCRAVKACPFGDLTTDHYSTPEDARASYELGMAAFNLQALHRKYPRTPHLPFSASRTSDDVAGQAWLWQEEGQEMVITEKMDGENTTIYRDGYHARSLDSKPHASRTWAAALQGEIGWRLPPGRRLVCENVYAEHSIRYESLPGFVLGIGVVDLRNEEGHLDPLGKPYFLPWDEAREVFQEVGVPPVPELHRGPGSMKVAQEVFRKQDHERSEGIVVRSLGGFWEGDFGKHVGKAVRPHHVQTDDKFWQYTWKPNGLQGGA